MIVHDLYVTKECKNKRSIDIDETMLEEMYL